MSNNNESKKLGNLHPTEKVFIAQYADARSDEWIAEQINRTVDVVRRYRESLTPTDEPIRDTKRINDKFELKKKPYWKELQKQFDRTELILFHHNWADLIDQFNNDVTSSEELQILTVCKLEILVDRNLKDQKANRVDIQRYQDEIDKEILNEEGGDEDRVRELEAIIQSFKASGKQLSQEFTSLNKERQALFDKLKMTRDQRIRILHDSKTTWNSLIQALQNEKMRQEEGRRMAVFKAAMQKEYNRLSDYHQFLDNNVDRPLLTAETANLDKSEENEECERSSPESQDNVDHT